MKFSSISFTDVFVILIKRKKITLGKVMNLLKNLLGVLGKKSRMTTLPSFIMLDPTKLCNLSCTDCVKKNEDFVVESNLFAKNTFFKIIDEVHKHTMIMALYLSGEPFLNKNIFEMIKYGHDKRMYTFLSSNFNLKLDDKFASNIVNSGLDAMFISVSGFTNDVYKRMHVGGNVEILKENIRILQEKKKALNSKYPKVAIRYLVAKYNVDEMSQFSKFAQENDVEFFETSYMGFAHEDNHFENRDNPESLLPQIENKNKVCWWPWFMLGVHSDGQTQTCCYYYNQPPVLGNVSEQSVDQIWNSETQLQFRERMAHGGKYNLESCKNCEANFGFQRTMASEKPMAQEQAVASK
jgi:radical SAM protein with 4Fe4S-binding SPASM domain